MDYILDLYQRGDLTLREIAELLNLTLSEALELVGERVGGNVSAEE
ncbi:hypothetical protein [Geoglobus acetivorans]|uniref:Uncharacterized protein n=1 Tax=Geoglobus acetivorans TaxID=565033 RepID=A0ABZ3H0B6_GEOAI|nr:hypothetical protein [Geoglobus acetivorans]